MRKTPDRSAVSGALVICALIAGVAHGAGNLVLGPSDNIALDQPRVEVQVRRPETGESLGPSYFSSFLLDTGAQGLVVASYATSELLDNGYETVAWFDEQGVSGTSPYRISAPYDVEVTDSWGEALTLPEARLMSSTSANFGSFGGIVGMPAMLDRSVTLDLSSIPTYWALTTRIADAPPAPGAHAYTVPLEMVPFPPAGQRDPDDPLPTYAPLPFVDVRARNAGQWAHGSFVFDTGAQMSIISTATALAAGVDADGDGSIEDDAVGEMPVGGAGSTAVLPIVELDSLHMGTEECVDLVWTDLQVLVADIDGRIDGVVGSDLLTSGWVGALFGGDDGYIERAHLDFRQAATGRAEMIVEVNPVLDVIDAALPGDADLDYEVDVTDLAVLAANWGRSDLAWCDGDFTDDGRVDVSDLAVIATGWGQRKSSAVVPEPTCGALLGCAAMGMGLARRRRRQRT